MTPNMLRKLWSLVESSQPSLLLELDDGSLTHWLMSQMDDREGVYQSNTCEQTALENYIREHLLLIRDMADASWHEPFKATALA